ncbi:hypothetical protein Tco_0533913 [Tanacetum coccineum]
MGVKRLEIEKNVIFEIKSQLLRELRENTFFGGKTEDAMEHLRKILEIASLFNTPGISGNDIMLRIFPLTLTGAAKRLTASEALESIQEKVDHSHRWHKEESSNNSFSTITEKLKILNHDMSDLREEIHKINQKPVMEFHHKESMRMEQYLTHTDYALWEVIRNGDAPDNCITSAVLKAYEIVRLKAIQAQLQTPECGFCNFRKTLAVTMEAPQLDNEDLEQIDTDDLERWISNRMWPCLP